MKNFFKKLITAHSGISSKRFCGLIGFFVCIGIGIYAVISGQSVPEFLDYVLYASVMLLGVDSVTGIWKN